jgi:DNA-binding response OmpR family regulator
VQELVKLHGGTIAVTSGLGKGTTFKVHVPTGTAHLPHERITASRDNNSTAIGAAPFVEEALRWLQNAPGEAARDRNSLAEARAQTQNSNPVGKRGGKILIADDNADMRDYVQRLLADQYDVETTPDGGSALLAARERTPDLILTDIMMPGMDGLELLRALRADPLTNQIPIILLSARAGEESKVEGLDAGADDYLVKPFTARELRARVNSHLNIASERRGFAQELSARLSELEKANAEIRDARRAALNVLEDSVEARERSKQRYDKLEEQVDWLRGQSGALEAAVNGAPLEVSLGVLVRAATEALGREARAAFYLTHGEGASLRHIVGMPVEYAAALNVFQIGSESPARGLTTHAREQVLAIDVHEDPRWEQCRLLAERFGYRGVWSFPIHTTSGKFVGALAIYLAQLRKPDKRDMELVGLLTNTASIIISCQKESEARQRIEQARRES